MCVDGERWRRRRQALSIQSPRAPSQPGPPVTHLPAIAVTATTESIRGVLRVRANVSYTKAVRSAGARPYILPLLDPADADELLEGMDGLLLTGGEDVDPQLYGERAHPALGDVHAGRDALELALMKAARARRLPVLAICRGIQVANVALGGTLVQDIPAEHPGALAHDGDWPRDRRVHSIDADDTSRLAAALGARRLSVNSFHHQAIAQPAPDLRVVARAPDGIIEGVEWPSDDWWMLGAQWHPEELVDTTEPWDRSLFAAFVAAAHAERVSSSAASAPHS